MTEYKITAEDGTLLAKTPDRELAEIVTDCLQSEFPYCGFEKID